MASYGSVDKIGTQLLALKKRLEAKKSKRSEIQGELNSIKKQMKADFSTDDLDEIREQIEENDTRLANMEEGLRKQVVHLQEVLENMEAEADDDDDEGVR